MELLEANGGRFSLLRSELRQDWSAVDRLIDQAQEYATLWRSSPPKYKGMGLNALALALHHLYSAIEAGFERIAKRLDESMPEGGECHADLLRQMAIDVTGLRPALLDTELLRRLDEYRRFRHVVRKGYEHEYEWARMEHLVSGLPQLQSNLRTAVDRFDRFLAGMIERLSKEHPRS